MSSRITGVQQFVDVCHFLAEPVFATAFLTNAHVETGAAISADKLVNRHAISYLQPDGTAVVAATVYVFLARAAGTIK